MTKNKPDWPLNADLKDPFSDSEVAHPDPDPLADPITDFSPDSRSFSSLFSNDATYLLFKFNQFFLKKNIKLLCRLNTISHL